LKSAQHRNLFGTRDENLHVLEDGLNLNIDLRSNSSNWKGTPATSRAEQVVSDYDQLQRADTLSTTAT